MISRTHENNDGTTLVAFIDDAVVGLVTLQWRSTNPEFARRNIPIIHQVSVDSNYERQGIGNALMQGAEDLATERGFPSLGIMVGLFDEYGRAQRLYIKRGYVPDGRGVCRGSTPLAQGESVTVDHDLLLWLTKDLSVSL